MKPPKFADSISFICFLEDNSHFADLSETVKDKLFR